MAVTDLQKMTILMPSCPCISCPIQCHKPGEGKTQRFRASLPACLHHKDRSPDQTTAIWLLAGALKSISPSFSVSFVLWNGCYALAPHISGTNRAVQELPFIAKRVIERNLFEASQNVRDETRSRRAVAASTQAREVILLPAQWPWRYEGSRQGPGFHVCNGKRALVLLLCG